MHGRGSQSFCTPYTSTGWSLQLQMLSCMATSTLFMFFLLYSLLPFCCLNVIEIQLYYSLNRRKMKQKPSGNLHIKHGRFSALEPRHHQSGIGKTDVSKLESWQIYNHKYMTNQLEQVMQTVTKSSIYKDPLSKTKIEHSY